MLVGYGAASDGQEYWILRNSWGTSWGMAGYMNIAIKEGDENGICGVQSDAVYPAMKP